MDVFDSISLLKTEEIHVVCTMLDPWYNKGKGDVIPTDEYDSFINQLLESSGELSDLLYLWGFPEVIGPYVRYAPKDYYSVIEAPLIIGFVGKNEQTGHPSQKPEAVFDKLLLMAMAENQVVFDPMAGSGTTGASAVKNGFKAILCDKNDDYISLMENRLNVKRISI